MFSLTRRRFKIATVVTKATSRTNFEPTTQREEIAAVRSKNEFFEVPIIPAKPEQLRVYPEYIQSLPPVCAYMLFCRGRDAQLTRSRSRNRLVVIRLYAISQPVNNPSSTSSQSSDYALSPSLSTFGALASSQSPDYALSPSLSTFGALASSQSPDYALSLSLSPVKSTNMIIVIRLCTILQHVTDQSENMPVVI